ncbi:uncharacterized protein TRIADDRAFT_57380 [Trichoplax adhaerens]|uniref:NECAP PHear domain-containing protein n=1 Tax=Trichoplax adhaerens TaxID=10228 RepID=B3RZA3_TRIAD|nr:hypothetical protein TRIADDRAFT_57380 [Trichoplax adhaerens]EDV23806.1 hypothetical protein TRIADDRAFT_57380 [Trichoplax adhaerens]|eukprot:XP_002113332.1 hypothetical protein TRIADDRAFT_57380 [Trichoplax adhaerens]
MADYESILAVKPEVFVFQLPPRQSNRGYRAADWSLTKPDWTGRMRIIAKGKQCIVKLEDKSGELFAACPIDKYPGGLSVESVTDSSRYFVLKIVNENGQHAFIGIGFADRSDSFDFNVTLQEHFRWLKTSESIAQQSNEPEKPKLDLSLKEGQTIHINLKSKKDGESSNARKPAAGAGMGFLPPPPTSKNQNPQPVSAPAADFQPASQQSNQGLTDFNVFSNPSGSTGWNSFQSAG